jgi:hypothetical protein
MKTWQKRHSRTEKGEALVSTLRPRSALSRWSTVDSASNPLEFFGCLAVLHLAGTKKPQFPGGVKRT